MSNKVEIEVDTIGSTENKYEEEVLDFLVQLAEEFPKRYKKVARKEKGGYVSYAAALKKWIEDGRQLVTFFGYDSDKEACPLLLEFRKEISHKFGLDIFNRAEADERLMLYKQIVYKNYGKWSLN